MSQTKGDRWERTLRNRFDDNAGFTAVRMPSSGSATDADLPDLHVWYNDGIAIHQYAIEIKAFRERTNIDGEEIDALQRYAAATGAVPIVVAHVDYVGEFVFGVDDLHTTKGGNYSITKNRDVDDAVAFADYFPIESASS